MTRPDRRLRELAEQTGGGYFELTRTADLNSTFTRVADELHRQYVHRLCAGEARRLAAQARSAGEGARHDRARAQELSRDRHDASGRRAVPATRQSAQAAASDRLARSHARGTLSTSSRRGMSRFWSPPRRSSHVRRIRRSSLRSFAARPRPLPIYATVLDRYGEMVRNLERDDFIVEDDGRRQELTVFVKGFQPITAMVLVDTSASMTLNLDLARTAAEQFVIRMMPGDQVRVGSFSDRLDLSKGFTGDRDELLRALREDLHIGNPTKLWDAVGETMTELAPLGGRRILVLMTDGVDTMSTVTADDIIERAREDELMIYIVQFRSTPRGSSSPRCRSRPRAASSMSDPRRWTTPPTATLRRLATQTGGGHFLLNQYDDVNATFTQVMQELHYQYVLGFTPQRFDGKVHDLRVRIAEPGPRHRDPRAPQLPRAAAVGDRALFHRSSPRGTEHRTGFGGALSPCEAILWKRALSPIIDRLMPHPAGSSGPCSSAPPRLPCRRAR